MNKLLSIFSSKFLIGIAVIYIVTTISIYNFIPYKMEQHAINGAELKAESVVNLLVGTRQFYAKYIVADLLDKNITFSTDHKQNDSLPYPATFLHDLSKELKDPYLTVAVYSKFPFKHRLGRELSPRQKDILENISTDGTGRYIVDNVVDNQHIITVAKADYMTDVSCIKCHNTHPDKNWSFKWKMGDLRGVVEAVVPISPDVYTDIKEMQLLIIGIITLIIGISLFVYGFSLLKLRTKLEMDNENLNDEYSREFTELIMQNDKLNLRMKDMHSEFSDHVVYTKTNLFGVITDASDAFCKISGYSKSELLGKNHNIVRCPKFPKSTYKDLWDTIEIDKTWVGELKSLTKDGKIYWTNNIISPSYDSEGVKIGYISIKQNITDKKIKEIDTIKNELMYSSQRKDRRSKERRKD